MASRVLAFGVSSVLVLGGALTASSLLAGTEKDGKSNSQTAPSDTAPQGSAFDFNATFFGQTLSYKKNQVVAKVKEVGKEIKEAGAKVVEGPK